MPVIVWWLLLEGLGLVGLPLTFALFGPRTSYGYPFAKIAALLVLTYIGWLLGFVVPLGTATLVAGAALLALSATLAVVQRERLMAWLSAGGWRELGRHDALWTAGFLFFVFQRCDVARHLRRREVHGLRVPQLAAARPRDAAARSVDERRHDQLLLLRLSICSRTLMRLARLPVIISYNLCVATIGGLAFSQTAAVGARAHPQLGPGLLGGAMSALLGNLDGFVQFLQKGTLHGMDYWRSSRVVAQRRHDQRVPILQHHPRRPPSAFHGAAGEHPVARRPHRRAPLPVAGPSTSPTNPWRAMAPFALVAFVLGAMVAISNWELPMGVLVVALLAGRWQPLRPLVLARATAARGAPGRRADRRLRALHAVLPQFVPPLVRPGPNEPCIGSACFTVGAHVPRRVSHRLRPAAVPPALLVLVRGWELMPRGGGEGRHLLLAFAGLLIVGSR